MKEEHGELDRIPRREERLSLRVCESEIGRKCQVILVRGSGGAWKFRDFQTSLNENQVNSPGWQYYRYEVTCKLQQWPDVRGESLKWNFGQSYLLFSISSIRFMTCVLTSLIASEARGMKSTSLPVIWNVFPPSSQSEGQYPYLNVINSG